MKGWCGVEEVSARGRGGGETLRGGRGRDERMGRGEGGEGGGEGERGKGET